MLKICIDESGNIIRNIFPEAGDFDDCGRVATERHDLAVYARDVNIVVLVRRNEKIGFCSFFIESVPRDRDDDEVCVTYLIDYVFVKENERGKGLSKLMMPYVIRDYISVYKKLMNNYSFNEISLVDISVYETDGGRVFSREIKRQAIDLIRK